MSCVVRLLPWLYPLRSWGFYQRPSRLADQSAQSSPFHVFTRFHHMTLGAMARRLTRLVTSHLVFGKLGSLRCFFRFITHDYLPKMLGARTVFLRRKASVNSPRMPCACSYGSSTPSVTIFIVISQSKIRSHLRLRSNVEAVLLCGVLQTCPRVPQWP